jgi:nitrogen fixation-related uncharacterized protein
MIGEQKQEKLSVTTYEDGAFSILRKRGDEEILQQYDASGLLVSSKYPSYLVEYRYNENRVLIEERTIEAGGKMTSKKYEEGKLVESTEEAGGRVVQSTRYNEDGSSVQTLYTEGRRYADVTYALMGSGSFPSPTIEMRTFLLLCTRYAFSKQNKHRGTSIRITIGLALCLFAIIAVLAFMQALQRDQFDDIRTFESFDLQVDLATSDKMAAQKAAQEIEALSSVDAAFIYADIPVITQASNGGTVAGRIRGMEAEGRFLSQLNSYRGELFVPGMLASSYSNSGTHALKDEVKVTLLKKGRQATVIPSQKAW